MLNELKNLIEGRKTLVMIVAAVVAFGLIFATVSWTFGVKNEGEAMQERLESLHDQSRASLSACIDQGAVAAQVTEREFEALGDVLTEVASARYTENGQPTNASNVLGGGQLISALQENYPDIDQRSWQNLQTLVIGCRGEFESSQNRIFIDAQAFETWKQTDNPISYFVKKNFPTDSLDVENLATGETLTGADALAYITRVIEVSEARDAFETGERLEQDLFGDD